MNLIASVLHLDRTAIKALRIADPYSLHRVVYSLYPKVREAQAEGRARSSGILHADQGGDAFGRRILLLANRSPAERVDGKYGRVESKSVPKNFLDHSCYRFKTIVNPTRRSSATGKLVPVKGREAIADWFAERAPASWGFQVSLPHLQIDRVEVLQFKDKAKRTVTLAQAHVQGQLEVTDPERFRGSFANGIGRGRSFGCGLLQIVPLIDNPFEQKGSV